MEQLLTATKKNESKQEKIIAFTKADTTPYFFPKPTKGVFKVQNA